MIRSKLKKYLYFNTYIIYIASIIAILFFVFIYLGLTSKTKTLSVIDHRHKFEIVLFELTTYTKRILLEMDDSIIARILERKKELNDHLRYLKDNTDDSHSVTLKNLELTMFEHIALVDRLLTIEKRKKRLLNTIRNKILYIDSLLKIIEQKILTDANNIRNVDFYFYKYDILLSKLARELGLYLKTDDSKALNHIKQYFIALENEKRRIDTLKISIKQKKLFEELEHFVVQKNIDIKNILKLHDDKIKTLEDFSKHTDKFDEILDNNLTQELKLDLLRSDKLVVMSAIAFFVLFLLLGFFLLYSKYFFKNIGDIVTNGFRKILTATKQVAENEKITKSVFTSDKDEFFQISRSMIKMQNSLFQSNLTKEELKNILQSIGDFRCIINSNSHLSFVSDTLFAMSGYTKDDIMDVSIFGDCFSFEIFKALAKYKLKQELDWHIVDKNLKSHHIKLSAILLSETSVLIIGYHEKKDERNTDNVQGLILLNSDAQICEFSVSLYDSLDLPEKINENMILEDLFKSYTIGDDGLNIETIKELANSRGEIEVALTKIGTQQKHYLFIHVYELFMVKPKNPKYALTIQDMTKSIATEKHTLHLANYDALTGLLNRVSLFHKLNSLISLSSTQKLQFGLVLVSLTKFRDINDVYGYDIGDRLLVDIAKKLKIYFGDEQVLARLGGDEFAILYADGMTMDSIALHTKQLVTLLNKEIDFNGLVITPNVRAGVSIYPDDGLNIKTLLSEANIALERAKNETFYFAFSNTYKSKDIIRSIELAHALPTAFDNDEFSLLYQPQIDIEADKLYGVEALIRWEHPKFGNISPSTFIPIAEEIKLIDKLGLWVLHSVCKQILVWENEKNENIKVAVNISASHFESNGFADDIIKIVNDYKINPKYIQIEITESILQNIEHSDNLQHKRLSEYGFNVAIDDFGTGFSSLILLRKLYIKTIKIDKYFIDNLDEDQASIDLLSGIYEISKTLKLHVVIEGVENKKQLDILQKIGFTVFQGFYFSKPISPIEITQFKL